MRLVIRFETFFAIRFDIFFETRLAARLAIRFDILFETRLAIFAFCLAPGPGAFARTMSPLETSGATNGVFEDGANEPGVGIKGAGETGAALTCADTKVNAAVTAIINKRITETSYLSLTGSK